MPATNASLFERFDLELRIPIKFFLDTLDPLDTLDSLDTLDTLDTFDPFDLF